ncbi:serine hydrolase domain-containing protein [Bradyrhizobium sp. ARR65]|uniref:serine hydrolase domain-containing protein n=1 Tax=Bradyrhizobium sp. ARR65 TaxID=1040989 RepID=UPI0004658247|nr:serine hydrolase domain-containing protein [Bradyrhizobium sp. ARR65]
MVARWVGFAVIAGLAAVGATAALADITASAAASFSQAGLEQVSNYMRREIATGKIPGAILLIQQHGKPVYYEKFGLRDVPSKLPMTDDTIFRLYSMSKPVTAVAAMMLVDDGKLSLDDPVAKYIPAFADVKVGVEKRDEGGKQALMLEPLQRPITVLDLLRQTSGLTYGFYGEGAVRKLYAHSGLYSGEFDNAEFAARLAKLPLVEQPGTVWDYGHSIDVLGRVIEVASGKSLFEFEKERLLDPLGMTHTAFYVADETKRPLIAQFMPDDLLPSIAGIKDPTERSRWESGGAGMVGTLGDYARFAQMLLNGGTLDGKRYLKPETVALMTSDHIGPGSGIAYTYLYFLGTHSGYGLGLAVITSPPPHKHWQAGEYGWDGVGGTFFYVDPKDDLFVLCMMQTPSHRGEIETELPILIGRAMRHSTRP